MDASPVLETPIHLPWPSRIARRLRQAMSVPHETWRGGREEARKETLERRESDAFEVVLGSVRERRGTLFNLQSAARSARAAFGSHRRTVAPSHR